MKDFLLNLFFPRICLSCGWEEEYLCQDCKATLEILRIHSRYKTQHLSDLYYSCGYQNFLIKKIIKFFKYEPFLKELSKSLSSLIIEHLQSLENPPPFLNGRQDFALIPIPLEKRKLKRRGFNQAEEIGKELSKFLKIPLLNNVLIKTRGTLPQVELSGVERKENVKGVFWVQNNYLIKDKKILLVDDVYTTGSTMEEAARVLREAGTKEIIGLVVARAKPEEDYFKNI
jgi:ComF family protein